jgi:hypothetical protein
MADEAPAAPAEEVVEGEPKKKGPLVKIILIVVGVLLLIGLSVGGTLLATGFFNKKPKEAVDAQLDKLEGHGDGHAPAGDGHAPAGDGHGAPAADSHGKPAADSHGKPAAEPEGKELASPEGEAERWKFNYNWLIGDSNKSFGWLLFIPIVIFIVIAVSNGANMTDGLDGLASGTSAIIGLALAVLAYVSSNAKFADYLDVMYIPLAEELVIFIAAFVGACIGFMWYNSYPAQVFMGDTGSLALGGIIAVFAISIRKELLIPVLAGVFLVENLSVVLQVGYFKLTKKRFGEGRRIFLMAPLHHHYQKKGLHEAKIVSRFWIVGVLLAVITIVTLKLR